MDLFFTRVLSITLLSKGSNHCFIQIYFHTIVDCLLLVTLFTSLGIKKIFYLLQQITFINKVMNFVLKQNL